MLDASGVRPGSAGGGYVDFGDGSSSIGESTTFTFEVAEATTVLLHFRYANGGSSSRPLALTVNGTASGNLPFASTGSGEAGWNNWQVQTATVTLQPGTNTIGLSIGSTSLTGPNLDALAVTAPGGTPVFSGNPPSDVTISGNSVVENAVGAVIGTLAATDPDGDAVSFSVTDSRFQVDGNQLKLTANTSLNYEAGASVNVDVTATDATGLKHVTTIAVAVTNVDEAPTLAAGAAIAPVNVATGAVGTVNLATALNATDPEGAAVTYTAVTAGGGALPAGISVSNGVLTVGNTTPAGTYTLEASASDGSHSSAAVPFTVTVGGTPPATPTVIEAETGAITLATGQGTVTVTRDAAHPEPGLAGGLRPGYNGAGYVDFGDDAGDTVTYTITVNEAGTYDLGIRYASQDFGGQARSLAISINGAAAAVTPFPSTGPTTGATAGFNVWGVLTESVNLHAGVNTITLAIPPGASSGPNVDQLTLTRTGAQPDTSADEDGVPLFLSGPTGTVSSTTDFVEFNIAGRDADIVQTQISFDDGITRSPVTADADGDFTVDISGLADGNHTAVVIVTDDAGNTARSSLPFVIGAPSNNFAVTVQAETFTIQDVDNDSKTRTTAGNPESAANAGNSGPGLTYDSSGLWRNYAGTGYLDLGNDVGDSGSFTVNAPEAGTYHLTVRYALGASGARPMNVVVDGVAHAINFTTTGSWSTWGEASIDVDLTAGQNVIALTNSITNAPNIDSVTLTHTLAPEADEIRFEPVAMVNFQPAAGTGGLPAGFATPAGYVADTGAAYGARAGGLTYGWVTEASVADGTANGTVAADLPAGAVTYNNGAPSADNLHKTVASFEQGGVARAWEMAVANGSYQVKVSIGDTSGALGNTYALNIEGQEAMPDWSPTSGFRSTLVTAVVDVTDGRLTLDSIGGQDTEIQFVEVERLPDSTPGDGHPASDDYSFFSAPVADSLSDGQVSIAIGPNGQLPTDIDPTSTLVVGVVLRGTDYRGPNIEFTDHVKLVETLTGQEVPAVVQISGGADTLNVRPLEVLKENTSYTLKVEDVLDLGSFSDANAPLRQMHDLTTTFVTGTAPVNEQQSIAFDTNTLLNGFADGAGGFTTVELGPDGKLYVATITGDILRWSLNADGTINNASKETLSLDYFGAGGGERRGIIGFAFDPEHSDTIWVTDNAPIDRVTTAFSTPEFSGRISKITLGSGDSFTGATAQTYISGLPRSGGDHLTNSIEFHQNPDAGQPGQPNYLLYLTQGANSAAGEADPAWGGRPERLLSAAVLEVDPTRTPPAGGFDVRTEPVNPGDPPTTTFPSSQFNADGTYPGMYNPFAPNAVLKIYADGVRNAYDLVWHSNGKLYVPTNGTAAGGHTPTDPTQPGFDTHLDNAPKQPDFLFTVDEGKYYGHPNTLRGEYILNGGNPTSQLDPAEVVAGNDGNPSTDGYAVGVRPDPDYDLDGIYSLGPNRSPNGATEYTSGVFGNDIRGSIIFAQFSVGDNLRLIKLDSSGSVVGDEILRRPDGTVIDDFVDPLDVIVNPANGNLYVITLNRSTGASQLVLLKPHAGTSDTTADAGGDLTITPVNVTNPSAAVFSVTGVDSDVTAIKVSFNGGLARTVTLNAQGQFTTNLSDLSGPVTAVLTVKDDYLNYAEDSASFNLGTPQNYVTIATIQGEDRTPNDGTSVTIATGGGAQIVIRDALSPEPNISADMINGLRPGAFGTDGNTNYNDGIPGGYLDYGSTNADFATFGFNSTGSGPALIDIRYSNGGSGDRPLQLLVNGSVVSTVSFLPTSGFGVWQTVQVSADILAGANTITLRSVANTGPNIDQIKISAAITEPEPAHITNSGRIELEAGGPALIEDPDSVRFYFTVAESGVYRLDTAANAAAGNGGGLTWTLNDKVIEQTPFPGVGTANEQALYVSLSAGQTYHLDLDSNAPGANQLDYLDVSKVTLNANAHIGIQSQDPAYFDNRLHYSYLENAVQPGVADRDMKVDGVVRITNTGTAPLQVLDAIIDGPYTLANPNVFNNLTLAPGQGINVTVHFERSLYTPPTTNINGTSTFIDGKLTLVTNDQTNPVAEIDMSGFWQTQWEDTQEPSVNELWHVFGFGNRIEGLGLIDAGGNTTLATHDVYGKTDATEILSPYWQIADGVTTARATLLAAYHGPGGAGLQIHAPGNKTQIFELTYHSATDNQRVLPNAIGSNTAFATKTFTRADIPDAWNGDDVFGINMADLSTDPRLNPRGPVLVAGEQQGQTVKMFQAYDAEGHILPNVYLGIQDYTGINYDYNDNIFVFEGIKPVGVGPTSPLAHTYPAPEGTPTSDLVALANFIGSGDGLI